MPGTKNLLRRLSVFCSVNLNISDKRKINLTTINRIRHTALTDAAMVIDYSKWDNLTVSSDEVEAESVDAEDVSCAVAHGLPSGNKSETTKISSKHPPASKSRVKMLINCGACSKLIEAREIKYCSRCKIRGYCSKECQSSDWKEHKLHCCKPGTDDLGQTNKAQRAAEKLAQLLAIHSSKKIFATADSTSTSCCLIDLATVAKHMLKKQGVGILVIFFDNYEACEDFVMQTSLAVQGNASEYPKLQLGYEPWPFNSPDALTPFQKSLHDTNIKAIMDIFDDNYFAFCVTVPSSQEGANDGFTQSFRIPYRSVENPMVPLKTPVSAVPRSKELAIRISDSPDYQQCREAMAQVKKGPGILWLRNIFTLKNGYERRELKKISPKKLLRGLKVAITKHEPGKYGYTGSVKNFPAVFSAMRGDGTYSCPFVVEELLPSDVVAQKADRISNPNAVYGFFITYMHSESDATVMSEFSFSLPKFEQGVH